MRRSGGQRGEARGRRRLGGGGESLLYVLRERLGCRIENACEQASAFVLRIHDGILVSPPRPRSQPRSEVVTVGG